MTAVEELVSKLLHPARLLFVKSDKAQVEVLQRQIQQKYECTVDWVATGEEARQRLKQKEYDLLLLEATPQDMPAAAVLRCAREKVPPLPAVLVFGQPNEQVANEVSALGVVCGVIEPLVQAHIDDLFTLFKIHVRSCENTRYLDSRGSRLSALAG